MGISSPVTDRLSFHFAGSVSRLLGLKGTRNADPENHSFLLQKGGEANESLGVDYDGPEVTIGFNAKYLMDFVNVVGTEKVLLSVKNEMSQGLLRPQNGDGQDYKYVIMPMRV